MAVRIDMIRYRATRAPQKKTPTWQWASMTLFAASAASGAHSSLACLARYSATPLASAFMASWPFCQPAGQTSPFSSKNCSASIMRSISSTSRPSCKLLTTWCWTMPSRSIRNEPRSATPSGCSMTKARVISCLTSATMGKPTGPMPPFSTGVLRQAAWVNCESIDTPPSSAPRSRNLAARLLWAMISVGHTKVKSNGQKNSTTYLPRRLDRLKLSLTLPSANTAGATKSGAGLVTNTVMKLSFIVENEAILGSISYAIYRPGTSARAIRRRPAWPHALAVFAVTAPQRAHHVVERTGGARVAADEKIECQRHQRALGVIADDGVGGVVVLLVELDPGVETRLRQALLETATGAPHPRRHLRQQFQIRLGRDQATAQQCEILVIAREAFEGPQLGRIVLDREVGRDEHRRGDALDVPGVEVFVAAEAEKGAVLLGHFALIGARQVVAATH